MGPGEARRLTLWKLGLVSSSQMIPRGLWGGCATYRPLRRLPQGTEMAAVGQHRVHRVNWLGQGSGPELQEANRVTGF